MNIIIVDDSLLIRDQLKELLNEYAEIAVIADTDDISEAISISTKIIIDYFIIDIGMFKGNGFVFLKYIKKYNPAAKVILLTNDSSSSYHAFAMKLGADFFFDKANEFSKLPEVILTKNPGISEINHDFVMVPLNDFDSSSNKQINKQAGF